MQKCLQPSSLVWSRKKGAVGVLRGGHGTHNQYNTAAKQF